jgi:TatD DNase family protein
MGNKTELNQAIDRGCWFSVGPAMLATKRGQELISLVPQNRVLPESDGPFAKWKGRPLMPWDVELSFEQLAKIWGTTFTGVKEKIHSNFRTLVSLA